ncbi:hypothetical protein RQP54_07480 [Curvibacter sp. APW13]|uniref:hypothetical protein n=1 Tax=Curvibacter sp. APW13 TaxID=3077236 RepID=UPI0028E05F5E|nr:hypothetical protein [Curvibacter sp. APW13]MDT8990706.1 hypothetical protein [Curvibacter sp. APW13]
MQDDQPVNLPVELTDWLATNFPDRELHTLGPSEHSGWISGGPCMKVLALTTEEVQRFSQRWEDANGKSIDDRWQCYQWPYQMWRDKCDRIEVTQGRPPNGTQYRWLLCSKGLYWLRGRYSDATHNPEFPGRACFDDWWVVCQRFPEVMEATKTLFMMGNDYVAHDGTRTVVFDIYQRDDHDLKYVPLWETHKSEHATEKVRAALGLSSSVEIHLGDF